MALVAALVVSSTLAPIQSRQASAAKLMHISRSAKHACAANLPALATAEAAYCCNPLTSGCSWSPPASEMPRLVMRLAFTSTISSTTWQGQQKGGWELKQRFGAHFQRVFKHLSNGHEQQYRRHWLWNGGPGQVGRAALEMAPMCIKPGRTLPFHVSRKRDSGISTSVHSPFLQAAAARTQH